MKLHLTAVAAAMLVVVPQGARAEVKLADNVSLTGFGTVAAVHSSDKNSDFLGTIFQPNGVGHTHSTSLNSDSKLGVQVTATLNDKLSAVVQVISQHQWDNTWRPQVEWANLKYQLTPEISARIGRIAAPSYMLSETRYVNYSMPWARVPQEPYSMLSITSNDGVDATWRTAVGGVNNTLQVFYGKSEAKFLSGQVTGDPNWGINDTVDIGSLSVRAGYNSMKYDLVTQSLAPLFGAMKQLGLTDMLAKYDPSALKVSALALGATYDPGDWFVMSELISFKGAGFVSDGRAWYVSGGYRFGSLTPYVTLSGVTPSIKQETAGGPLNAGINATLSGLSSEQDTRTLGLRWDAMKNLALKFQYDRIATGATSNGRFMPYPGFVKGSTVTLVTVAADFVF